MSSVGANDMGVEMQTGGSLQSLRRTNQERLVGLLLQHGPAHRAELARQANVSRTTVSTIINDLLDRGVVIENDQAPPNGSPVKASARQLIAINPAAGAAAGLEYSRDDVWAHLTDLEQRELASGGKHFAPDTPPTERVVAGIELLDDLALEAGRSGSHDLLGVGVGVPGPIQLDTGEVDRSIPNLWAGVHAAEEFTSRLDIPVYVENNMRLAAVAEATWGRGQGIRDLFYVGLSSGIVGSLVLDGKLYQGSIGSAGELGHMSVNPDGPACPCGNRGCLVLYAGAQAILGTLRPHLGETATFDDVVRAATDGDRACLGVLTDVGRIVGQLLANLCNLLNPELIVIGGQVSRGGEFIAEVVREQIRRYTLSLSRDVTVEIAAIGPLERAGAMGGAALVSREIPRVSAQLTR